MPHVQIIPAQNLEWEHGVFEGRRIGGPSSPPEEERLRWWGLQYGAFGSTEDAKWLRDPIMPLVPSRVYGSVMDRFFWDPALGAAGQYSQLEAQVYACLHWFFTGNPTADELALTENMEFTRARMAGAELFSGSPYAFTVTELPEERSAE